MDKIAELSGMRFGVEIETIGISRKDTVSAIWRVVGVKSSMRAVLMISGAVRLLTVVNGMQFPMLRLVVGMRRSFLRF